MSSFREQCRATKLDGERCRGNAVDDEGLWFVHSPQLAEQRREGAVRGGKGRTNLIRLSRMMPERLAPVYERLEEVIEQLHKGKLDPRIAHAMAAVARVMVSVVEAGELEQRLRELEEKSAAIDTDRPIRRFR